MYILHYSLGFPPYRIGGLTKFCMDMIDYQLKVGNHVSLLWPGRISGGKCRIKHSIVNGYDSFELINPLPVSICNGIDNEREYTKQYDITVFNTFLDNYKPNVVHVHTLEGLPIEFLQATKKRNIRMIYSTHDFFGVCPTNDLYKDGFVCDVNCIDCMNCNQNAFSMSKVRVMQSLPYRFLKNTSLLTFLRKKIRKDAKSNVSTIKEINCDYSLLKEYYRECFKLFDIIHCNSSVTYDVFEKFIGPETLRKINITNSAVVDRRFERNHNTKDKVRILYLGVEVENKGFYFLIDVLDQLYKKRNDFELVIYSQDDHVSRDYIEKHGTYSYSELPQIYGKTDLLVVPSLRLETFGFVTIEAYYHGVPALVMDTVGSKDIIVDNVTGFVTNKNGFKETLELILNDKEKLLRASNKIKISDLDISIDKTYDELYTL